MLQKEISEQWKKLGGDYIDFSETPICPECCSEKIEYGKITYTIQFGSHIKAKTIPLYRCKKCKHQSGWIDTLFHIKGRKTGV